MRYKFAFDYSANLFQPHKATDGEAPCVYAYRFNYISILQFIHHTEEEKNRPRHLIRVILLDGCDALLREQREKRQLDKPMCIFTNWPRKKSIQPVLKMPMPSEWGFYTSLNNLRK